MLKQIEKTICEYEMLSHGDSVLVGLSGGADSVCLCDALWCLQEKLGIRVRAVHVNHGIRGEEAERDAAFCEAFAKERGIPFSLHVCNVPKTVKETGEGEEECARRLRYAAFEALAEPQEKIATAHTASDNAETVLLHMARGTGLSGLCGIPPVRGRIIRPLLSLERTDTEHYCAENGLAYVTDSTNLSKDYARNLLRMEALPAMKTVNPSLLSAVTRMTELLRTDEAFLKDCTERAEQAVKSERGLQKKAVLELPKAIAMRVIKRFLDEHLQTECALSHIEAVYGLLMSGNSISLPEKTLYSDGEFLTFLPPQEKAEPFEITVDLRKAPVQHIEIPHGTLQFQQMFIKDLQKLYKVPFYTAIDCAKISNVLILRSRKEGDSFESKQRKVRKSLKKWQNELKIPPCNRNQYAILSSDDQVVWAEGMGVSAPFLPDENTKQILFLTLQNGGNTNE